MNQLITVSDLSEVSITLDPEAIRVRDALLSQAASITAIDDPLDADLAVDILRQVNAHLKTVEAVRSEIKAPVLALGRRIDDLAKTHVAELDAHKTRLSRLSAAWVEKLRREQEEREREARRKEQERLRLLAEEQAALAAAAAESGESETVTETVQAAAMTEAVADISAIRAEAAAAAPSAIKGTGVRKTLKFEVVDAGALLSARPDVFDVSEPRLRAALKLLRSGESLPGVRHWEESTLSIRS